MKPNVSRSTLFTSWLPSDRLDLNLTWLREEGATDLSTLTSPTEVTARTAEELETALARFSAVAARLG